MSKTTIANHHASCVTCHNLFAYLNAIDHAGQGELGKKQQVQATHELKEALNKCWCDASKALKVASKLCDIAGDVEGPTARLKAAHQELQESTENCQKLVDDLGFAIKFMKTRSGAVLSVKQAQDLTFDAAKNLQDVLDITKSVRVLMPKLDST